MAATEQELELARQQALAVICPLYGAQPEDACTYRLAIREDESGRFLRWEDMPRSPHQPRMAVATDGRFYGYALRQMESSCRCGRDDMMHGRHPVPSCPWHERRGHITRGADA